MIIQIDNDILKIKDKSMVIFDKNTNSFKLITLDEIMADVRHEIEVHKKEFEVLQTQLNTLQKAELIENFKALKNAFDNDVYKERLINYMAFQLLNNDINNGEIDVPQNYDFIKDWLIKQEDDIPDGFAKYIELVKGE